MYKIIVLALFALSVSLAVAAENKGNITFEAQNGPVVFSHDHHIKSRGIKCSACHFRTFASDGGSFQMKKDKLTKRDFCEHCHNGLKSFDARSEKNCTRCHGKLP